MDQRLSNPTEARIAVYRSILFVPASNERALTKAPTLSADAFVLDLEDSVAPDRKAAARKAVAQVIGSAAFSGREVIVRVNAAPGDAFESDLEFIAASPPDGVLIPKVTSGTDLDMVIDRMETSDLADMPLWAMVETAAAVLRLEELTACAPRVAGLFFGANDLASDLGLAPGDAPSRTLLTAAAMTVIAARSAGMKAIGPVYNDIRDRHGFATAAAADADNGFDGKALIHPSQIELANKAFSPSDAELDEARAILAAFEKARASGAGVALHKGKMIEELHVDAARRLLAVATKIRSPDAL